MIGLAYLLLALAALLGSVAGGSSTTISKPVSNSINNGNSNQRWADMYSRGRPSLAKTKNDMDQPGVQVINSILANMWPSLGKNILSGIKRNPVLIANTLILELHAGQLRYPPRLSDVKPLPPKQTSSRKLFGSESEKQPAAKTCDTGNVDTTIFEVEPPLFPPRFEAVLHYHGRPDLELVLKGADKKQLRKLQLLKQQQLLKQHQRKKKKSNNNNNDDDDNDAAPQPPMPELPQKRVTFMNRVLRNLVPDIHIDVKALHLQARLEVELDMHNKKLKFHFIEKPMVEWDLEFALTKAEIPLMGEDKLDSILTNILAGIDKDKPIRINF